MIEIIIGIEVAIAVVLALLNIREVFFQRILVKDAPEGEDLWLLTVIRRATGYLTFVGLYLILLTGLNALVGSSISTIFPWIRPINGLIFLLVIGGPLYVGTEMRRRRHRNHVS